MEDLIKVVKSLDDSRLLLNYKRASLLGNLLTGKGAIATSQGRAVNKKGKVMHRAGEAL